MCSQIGNQEPRPASRYNHPVQLKQALASAVERLDAADVGSPRMNAEVLLMFVLGADRAYLTRIRSANSLRRDSTIRSARAARDRHAVTVHHRAPGILGLGFRSLARGADSASRNRAPRRSRAGLARGIQRPKLVDVGTGSGCIALALAHELRDAEIYAVDLSAEALEIARANAVRLQLDKRVRFLQCNVLEPVSQNCLRRRRNPPFALSS